MTDSRDSTFDRQVAKHCLPDPIIEKSVKTGACTLTVKVYPANYGKFLYYSISCDVPWKRDLTQPLEDVFEHPFRHLDIESDDEIGEIWEIVADNGLIRHFFNYIVMSEDELKTRTGHTTPVGYRAKLIQSLQYFWD